MTTTKGAPTEPQTSRKFTAILDNGKTVVMITMEPITKREAGRLIRNKLQQGGRLVK